jgi:hypothetical protein
MITVDQHFRPTHRVGTWLDAMKKHKSMAAWCITRNIGLGTLDDADKAVAYLAPNLFFPDASKSYFR